MKQKTLATITTILILTLLFTSLATAYIPRATPQETPNKILPTNTVTGKAGIDLETEMAKRQVEDVQENDYITINTVDNNLNGKHKVTAAQDTDGDGWIDTITTQLVDINGNPRSGASNTRTITLYDVTYADGFTVASADGTRTSSHSQTSTYTGPSTSNQPVRAAEARANSDTTRSAPPSTPATNPSIIQPTSPEALPDLFAVQWTDGIVGVATRDSTDTNKFNIYNNKGKLIQTKTAQEIQDMPASGISLHTITPGQTDNENMNTVTIPGDTSRRNFGSLRMTQNTDGTYNLIQDKTFSNPTLARGRTSSESTTAQPENVVPESIPAPAPQQTLPNNPITPALPVADGTSQPAQPVADSTGGVAGASSATNAARTGTTTDERVDTTSGDSATTPPTRRTSMPAPADGPPAMIGGATTTVDLPPDTRIFYGTISTNPYTLEQTPSMQAPILFVKNADGSITAYDKNGNRYLQAENHPEDITPIKPIQQSSDIPADLASTWRQAGYIVQSTSSGQPQLIYDSWGRDNVLIGTIPDGATSTGTITPPSEPPRTSDTAAPDRASTQTTPPSVDTESRTTASTIPSSGTTSTSRTTTASQISDQDIRRMTDAEFETYINNQFTPLFAPPSPSIGTPGTGTGATSPQTVTATIQNALRARGQDLVLTQDTRDSVASYLETRQDHGDTVDPQLIQQTRTAPTSRPEPTPVTPTTNAPVLTTPERAAAAGRTRLLDALHATTIPELQQLTQADIAGGRGLGKINLAPQGGTPQEYTITGAKLDANGKPLITVKDTAGNTLEFAPDNTQQASTRPNIALRLGAGLTRLIANTPFIGEALPNAQDITWDASLTYTQITPATQANAGPVPVDTTASGTTINGVPSTDQNTGTTGVTPVAAPQPAPTPPLDLAESTIAGITTGQYVTLRDTPNKNGAYKVTSVEDTNGDGTPDRVIAQSIDDNGNILPGPTTVQVQITPQDLELADITIEDTYPARTPSTPVAASPSTLAAPRKNGNDIAPIKAQDTPATQPATSAQVKLTNPYFGWATVGVSSETARLITGPDGKPLVGANGNLLFVLATNDPTKYVIKENNGLLKGQPTITTITLPNGKGNVVEDSTNLATAISTGYINGARPATIDLSPGGPALGIPVHVTAGASGSTNPTATPTDTPLATQPDAPQPTPPTTGTAPETDAAALTNALTPPGQGAVPGVAFGTITDTSVDTTSGDSATTPPTRRTTIEVPADDPSSAVARPTTFVSLPHDTGIFYGTISTNPSAPKQTPIMQTPILFVKKSDGSITAYDKNGNRYSYAEDNQNKINDVKPLQQSSDIPEDFAAGWIQAGYIMQDTSNGQRQLVYDSHGSDDVIIGTVPDQTATSLPVPYPVAPAIPSAGTPPTPRRTTIMDPAGGTPASVNSPTTTVVGLEPYEPKFTFVTTPDGKVHLSHDNRNTGITLTPANTHDGIVQSYYARDAQGNQLDGIFFVETDGSLRANNNAVSSVYNTRAASVINNPNLPDTTRAIQLGDLFTTAPADITLEPTTVGAARQILQSDTTPLAATALARLPESRPPTVTLIDQWFGNGESDIQVNGQTLTGADGTVYHVMPGSSGVPQVYADIPLSRGSSAVQVAPIADVIKNNDGTFTFRPAVGSTSKGDALPGFLAALEGNNVDASSFAQGIYNANANDDFGTDELPINVIAIPKPAAVVARGTGIGAGTGSGTGTSTILPAEGGTVSADGTVTAPVVATGGTATPKTSFTTSTFRGLTRGSTVKIQTTSGQVDAQVTNLQYVSGSLTYVLTLPDGNTVTVTPATEAQYAISSTTTPVAPAGPLAPDPAAPAPTPTAPDQVPPQLTPQQKAAAKFTVPALQNAFADSSIQIITLRPEGTTTDQTFTVIKRDLDSNGQPLLTIRDANGKEYTLTRDNTEIGNDPRGVLRQWGATIARGLANTPFLGEALPNAQDITWDTPITYAQADLTAASDLADERDIQNFIDDDITDVTQVPWEDYPASVQARFQTQINTGYAAAANAIQSDTTLNPGQKLSKLNGLLIDAPSSLQLDTTTKNSVQTLAVGITAQGSTASNTDYIAAVTLLHKIDPSSTTMSSPGTPSVNLVAQALAAANDKDQFTTLVNQNPDLLNNPRVQVSANAIIATATYGGVIPDATVLALQNNLNTVLAAPVIDAFNTQVPDPASITDAQLIDLASYAEGLTSEQRANPVIINALNAAVQNARRTTTNDDALTKIGTVLSSAYSTTSSTLAANSAVSDRSGQQALLAGIDSSSCKFVNGIANLRTCIGTTEISITQNGNEQRGILLSSADNGQLTFILSDGQTRTVDLNTPGVHLTAIDDNTRQSSAKDYFNAYAVQQFDATKLSGTDAALLALITPEIQEGNVDFYGTGQVGLFIDSATGEIRYQGLATALSRQSTTDAGFAITGGKIRTGNVGDVQGATYILRDDGGLIIAAPPAAPGGKPTIKSTHIQDFGAQQLQNWLKTPTNTFDGNRNATNFRAFIAQNANSLDYTNLLTLNTNDLNLDTAQFSGHLQSDGNVQYRNGNVARMSATSDTGFYTVGTDGSVTAQTFDPGTRTFTDLPPLTAHQTRFFLQADSNTNNGLNNLATEQQQLTNVDQTVRNKDVHKLDHTSNSLNNAHTAATTALARATSNLQTAMSTARGEQIAGQTMPSFNLEIVTEDDLRNVHMTPTTRASVVAAIRARDTAKKEKADIEARNEQAIQDAITTEKASIGEGIQQKGRRLASAAADRFATSFVHEQVGALATENIHMDDSARLLPTSGNSRSAQIILGMQENNVWQQTRVKASGGGDAWLSAFTLGAGTFDPVMTLHDTQTGTTVVQEFDRGSIDDNRLIREATMGSERVRVTGRNTDGMYTVKKPDGTTDTIPANSAIVVRPNEDAVNEERFIRNGQRIGRTTLETRTINGKPERVRTGGYYTYANNNTATPKSFRVFTGDNTFVDKDTIPVPDQGLGTRHLVKVGAATAGTTPFNYVYDPAGDELLRVNDQGRYVDKDGNVLNPDALATASDIGAATASDEEVDALRKDLKTKSPPQDLDKIKDAAAETTSGRMGRGFLDNFMQEAKQAFRGGLLSGLNYVSGDLIAGYDHFKGLSQIGSLFIDQAHTDKRRKQMMDKLCDNFKITSTECIIKEICTVYLDNAVIGSTIGSAGDPDKWTGTGTYIAATKSRPIHYINATSGVNVTEWIYRVQLRLKAPADQDIHYNLVWTDKQGRTYNWWATGDQTVKAGGSASITGANSVIAYKKGDYTRVCLVTSPQLRNYDNKPIEKYCRNFEDTGGPTTGYGQPGSGTGTAGQQTGATVPGSSLP